MACKQTLPFRAYTEQEACNSDRIFVLPESALCGWNVFSRSTGRRLQFYAHLPGFKCH